MRSWTADLCAIGLLLAAASLAVGRAAACPFCGVVGEPLARQRDDALLVAIGEAAGPARPDAVGLLAAEFRVLQVLPRHTPVRIEPPADVTARVAGPVEGTAVLLATMDDPPRWTAVAANEGVLAYVVAAPGTHLQASERLPWFARRLEHPEPVIAADAFAEFALAPFSDVRAAARALAARPLAAWVADPRIDQRRRGFYGLALGIIAAEGLPADQPASSAPLRAALASAVGDFRAGSDGLMAGILVADGEAGLGWLLERTGPDRPVDQRQLLAGLRFAHEELRGSLPARAVVAATATLARSAAVAADAIVDLARYEAWGEVDAVADWWDRSADDPLIRRAVVGYLSACPEPMAGEKLDSIRRRDPQGLDLARAALQLPLGQ